MSAARSRAGRRSGGAEFWASNNLLSGSRISRLSLFAVSRNNSDGISGKASRNSFPRVSWVCLRKSANGSSSKNGDWACPLSVTDNAAAKRSRTRTDDGHLMFSSRAGITESLHQPESSRPLRLLPPPLCVSIRLFGGGPNVSVGVLSMAPVFPSTRAVRLPAAVAGRANRGSQ